MDESVAMDGVHQFLDRAEILSKVSLMTSPAAKRRLVAKSLQLQMGHLEEESGDYMPSRQLLLYLVRMGSFNSSPKLINDDSQDNDVLLPDSINRSNLLQYLKGNAERADLYPMMERKFSRATHLDHDYITKFEKTNSVSKACFEQVSSPYHIRILQWNILSQALGVESDNFVRCPEEALNWRYRRYRIIEEIVQYDPDIICLQEVDHFNFFKNVLGSQGYTGTFIPKPDSPCFYIQGNNGPDGCAIFYRNSKFESVKTESKVLEFFRVPCNQVALLTVLKIRETGEEVCVTTTHLKARTGPWLPTFRNEQGKDLLHFVSTHCDNKPVILCGDFNAEPTEPIYETILSNQRFKFSSAYADCGLSRGENSAEREPSYTTWKIREEGEVCHTIDYVFYSQDNMKVEAVLNFPNAEQIGQDRVPSFLYPSDHFSLVCDFKLNCSL